MSAHSSRTMSRARVRSPRIHLGFRRNHVSSRAKEGQGKFSSPPHQTAFSSKLLLRRLGAIGRATALALARVLAFAAVVAGFATALALAGVLALTSVLFFDVLVALLALILSAEGSLQRWQQSRSLKRSSSSGEQPR